MGNKTFILYTLLLCILAVKYIECSYSVPVGLSEDEEFEHYKAYFEKHYNTPEENAEHKATYFKTKARLEALNKQYEAEGASLRVGINQFADLSDQQFSHQNNAAFTRREPGVFIPPEGATIDQEWELFKTHFKKSYATPTEEQQRKANFLESRKSVVVPILGKDVFVAGLNRFADLTREEFRQKHQTT